MPKRKNLTGEQAAAKVSGSRHARVPSSKRRATRKHFSGKSSVLPKPSKSEPIEAVLQSLADGVPETEWQKLPSDLTEDLDHYLYGTPLFPPARY
ncbi:MAG: hypothetical protein WCA94_20020 [Candidatus Acidiferrum sp.]